MNILHVQTAVKANMRVLRSSATRLPSSKSVRQKTFKLCEEQTDGRRFSAFFYSIGKQPGRVKNLVASSVDAT